jgi:HEPN domain-containing protein
MPEEIVIDCPHCGVRIKAKATEGVYPDDESGVFLVKCSSCKQPLLGLALRIQDERGNWAWDNALRLWPAPAFFVDLSESIPEPARRDIKDAQNCFTHGIYSAAAVLCGRALERLIKEKVGANMIGKGLIELRKQGVIDQRLFDWAEALRRERNIGAHASDEEITKENAQDVIDFTVAIFDYVYTLSEKYAKYVARKAKGK